MVNNGVLVKRENCVSVPARHSKCNDYSCGCWCHFHSIAFLGLSRRAKAKRFVAKLSFGLVGQDIPEIKSSTITDHNITFVKQENE